MINEHVYKMAFSRVYSLLVQKAERKEHIKSEVDAVIRWLTGYDDSGLQAQIIERKWLCDETIVPEAFQVSFLVLS